VYTFLGVLIGLWALIIKKLNKKKKKKTKKKKIRNSRRAREREIIMERNID
jgi:hypothetical protein